MPPTQHPSYLLTRQSGYHFRIRVPLDIRDQVGRTELRRSLSSSSYQPAQLEAYRLAATAKKYFDSIRSGSSALISNNGHAWEDQGSTTFAGSSSSNTESGKGGADTLQALIDSYSNEHIHTGNWTTKTQQENSAVYALLCRIIGNPTCCDISYPMLRKYKAVLIQLPANLNKSAAYRDRSIEQIIRMDCTPMAINTLNKNLSRVSSLLGWGVKNGYLSTNFAEGLQVKRNVRTDQERSMFTDAQLKQIFIHPQYTEQQYKHGYQYWLPLLGLYTGARLNELCQLHLNDICFSESIWTLSINADTPDKRAKTMAAVRTIPIHSELQQIGFLEHVETLKRQGSQRLFPDLTLTRDGYGRPASKWFARFRKSLDLTGNHGSKPPDFHSFRHNVSSRLRQNGHSIEDIGELLGHANSATTLRYTKRLTTTQLSHMVESLNYPVSVPSRLSATAQIVS